MKKQISIIAALLLAVCGSVQADTSYLLIQGPFGTSGAVETFKWQVNYTAGEITTGFDLLTMALSSQELQYTPDSGYGAFVNGFTLGGTSVPSNYPTATWLYYSAEVAGNPWTYSEVGASSRDLVDGSFDGWVYGVSTCNPDTWALTYSDPIVGTGNMPTTENFSIATNIEVVPEPSSIALIFAGAGGLLVLRWKLCKSQKNLC